MPTAEIRWRSGARRALRGISLAVAHDRPRAALRLVDRIESRVGLLAEQPRMGQRRNDIAPALRQVVEGPYIVLYRIVPDTDDSPVELVEIVSVVDGRRDLGSLF